MRPEDAWFVPATVVVGGAVGRRRPADGGWSR
jgi:hypothetical protein